VFFESVQKLAGEEKPLTALLDLKHWLFVPEEGGNEEGYKRHPLFVYVRNRGVKILM